MPTVPTDYVLRGVIGARPSAAIPGRLYIVDDNGLQRVTYDDGSAWHDVYVDSTWAGGAGGAVALIQRVTLAAPGTITLNVGGGSYRQLFLEGMLRTDRALQIDIARITFNGDSSAVYDNIYNYTQAASTSYVSYRGRSYAYACQAVGGTGDAGDYGHFRLDIPMANVSNINHQFFGSGCAYAGNADDHLFEFTTSGVYRPAVAAAITSITLTGDTGTLQAPSEVSLYGIS